MSLYVIKAQKWEAFTMLKGPCPKNKRTLNFTMVSECEKKKAVQ